MRQKQVKKKAWRRLEKKVNSQCAALQILAVKCGISKVSKSWMEMKRRFQLLYKVITKNLPRCRLFFLRRWSDFFAGVHLWQQAINVAINFTFFFKTTREKSQCVLNKKKPSSTTTGFLFYAKNTDTSLFLLLFCGWTLAFFKRPRNICRQTKKQFWEPLIMNKKFPKCATLK